MRITAVESIPIGYPEPNDHDRTRYVCSLSRDVELD